VSTALIVALGLCVASAALEGFAAGQGVKQRLVELRQPRYSPPFAVWIAIGVLYYVICFGISYRLLSAGIGLSLRGAAFALLLVLMASNILWNVVFFRRKDLHASYYGLWPYIGVALTLCLALWYSDPAAAWIFLPYVIYLSYAVWWGHRLWKLNAPVRRAA
jgi:tryptophan-rich sensory protein